MGLVEYSDSDSDVSDNETLVPIKAIASSSKSTFQKVVDPSNPGKIRISLPQVTEPGDAASEEPAAKRAKIGSSAFGGFNSFLPPPKRASTATAGTLGRSNGTRGSGLGAGVGLKTGAAPGFDRSVESDMGALKGGSEEFSNAQTTTSCSGPNLQSGSYHRPAEEVKLVGRPLMFKPLSVARNPTKKKQAITSNTSTKALNETSIHAPAREMLNPAKPKVSLFSMATEAVEPTVSQPTGAYRPLLHGMAVEEADEEPGEDLSNYAYDGISRAKHVTTTSPSSSIGAQSLADIASDLGLTAAERRQLFGRQKDSRVSAMPSATNVINFNTDKEYQHNEELRAAGEQVVHNPVRAIAPGKHSLKQLVNAAANQKEALEESFARGKSNRAEASSRYGW